MNKLLVISFVAMLIVALFPNNLSAQIKYVDVNKNTYVFDYSKNVVYNKNTKLANSQEIATCGFDIQSNSIVRDVIKDVLPIQRIKELKGEKMAITFECDATGKIKNVRFIFTKTPFLTALEINKLENSFLSKSFTVKSNLNKDIDISFSIPCFFSRLSDS